MPGRSSVSGGPAKQGFTGHELDSESGLIYAGARYYIPNIGRWTGVDPLAGKYPGWSAYNYVLNNPLGFVDPDGMAAKGKLEVDESQGSRLPEIKSGCFGGHHWACGGAGRANDPSNETSSRDEPQTRARVGLVAAYLPQQITVEERLTLHSLVSIPIGVAGGLGAVGRGYSEGHFRLRSPLFSRGEMEGRTRQTGRNLRLAGRVGTGFFAIFGMALTIDLIAAGEDRAATRVAGTLIGAGAGVAFASTIRFRRGFVNPLGYFSAIQASALSAGYGGGFAAGQAYDAHTEKFDAVYDFIRRTFLRPWYPY